MGSDSYAGKIVVTDKSGDASARSPMEIALADDIAALDVSISRNGHGAMSQELEPQPDSSRPMAYQIRITGQLDARWADWFEGLTITLEGGDTLITGPVVDQAALHGLLKRVRDLGMPLVSVSPVNLAPRQRSGQARQMWQMSSRTLAWAACLRQSRPQQGDRGNEYERTNRRSMRAVVCTDYGPPDVLQLRDVPKPVPKDNEVLVRIRATTVSAADCELRRFDFAPWIWVPIRLAFGIRRPRQPVLGQELAGDVESVGRDVRSFGQGDRVFAATGIGLGAYAEYICLRENPQTGAIATMPANLRYEEAAAVPYGGGEALEFLRKGNVRSGQRVLVNGAGGSFGTFAVQLAKVLGAHVTAVDSAPKLEMLRTIGADRVIDYSQEDFTDSPETYDVIFDVVRNTPSGRMVRLLTENGWLLMANPGFLQIVRARWASRRSKKRVSFAASGPTSEDLAYLRGLVEAGRLHPVIDRRFRLEQMVEAHRYAETGQKLGNVVIVVA